MNLDRAGDVIWITGAMMLVGSALIVRWRRGASNAVLTMALIWAGIFAALFGIAHWLDGRQ
jgi:hypothetical protein